MKTDTSFISSSLMSWEKERLRGFQFHAFMLDCSCFPVIRSKYIYKRGTTNPSSIRLALKTFSTNFILLLKSKLWQAERQLFSSWHSESCTDWKQNYLWHRNFQQSIVGKHIIMIGEKNPMSSPSVNSCSKWFMFGSSVCNITVSSIKNKTKNTFQKD